MDRWPVDFYPELTTNESYPLGVANSDFNIFPDDVLRLILLYLVSELKQTPLQFTHINQRFRALALNMPNLWSTIPNWGFTRHPYYEGVLLGHFITHSQRLPLTLRLSSMDVTFMKALTRSARGLRDRVGAIQMQFDLWRALNENDWVLCESLWGSESSKLCPNLRSLSLIGGTYRRDHTGFTMDFPIISNPFLTTLSLTLITFAFTIWQNTLESLPALTSIKLDRCTVISPNVLSRNRIVLPHLEHLTLNPSLSSVVFVTQSLQSLSYTGTSLERDILSNDEDTITFPDLESITYSNWGNTSADGIWLSTEGQYGTYSLNALNWVKSNVQNGAPLKIIAVRLRGNASEFMADMMHWLEMPLKDGGGCPGLKELDLQVAWPPLMFEDWEAMDVAGVKEIMMPIITRQKRDYGIDLRVVWNTYVVT